MDCPHRAILIVTREIRGTATNVARERVELSCSEPSGHGGPHRARERDEQWEDKGAELTHVLRHETE